MRVTVTLVLDVDPEAWDLAYGTGTDQAAVRADVKDYAADQVRHSAAGTEGGIRSVEVRT